MKIRKKKSIIKHKNINYKIIKIFEHNKYNKLL